MPAADIEHARVVGDVAAFQEMAEDGIAAELAGGEMTREAIA